MRTSQHIRFQDPGMNQQAQNEIAKSPKVFGIGFSKTGTTSLERALKWLGYNTWWGHWKNPNIGYAIALYVNRDYDELFKLTNYYDVFADSPWGGSDLYLEIYNRLPGSKYILTVRDADSWYSSLERNLIEFDSNPETALDSFHANERCGAVYFFKHVFGIETLANNKQKIIDHYNAHNESVIKFFGEHDADFMVFDLTAGDGWEKLCRFVNQPIPDLPFPHFNKRPDAAVPEAEAATDSTVPAMPNEPSASNKNDSLKAPSRLGSVITRIPFLRRPFYQRDLARQQREIAVLERNAAIQEVQALRQARDERQRISNNGTSIVPTNAPRLCVFCNQRVEAWLPFHVLHDEASFIRRVGAVGSNTQRFYCPHCRSNDRERHLRLFMESLLLLDDIKRCAVLHIAPEPRLSDYISRQGPSRYVKGDLNPRDESVQKIDAQRIPFPDETFDFVIGNHILEHVEDPSAALREIYRVLKPGGRLICQTPFASRLTKTLEEPLLQAKEDRCFFYGQDDHLRIFGLDLEERIRQVGFVGRIVPHEEILPDVDPEVFGINEKEPFFDFVRAPPAAI